MDEKTLYFVIKAGSLSNLMSSVRESIEEGYIAQGGVSATYDQRAGSTYTQAMVPDQNNKEVVEKSTDVNTELRHPIREFALKMEDRLKENNAKSGWNDCTNTYLIYQLKGNLERLEVLLLNQHSKDRIDSECADIGNYAMMISNNKRRDSK